MWLNVCRKTDIYFSRNYFLGRGFIFQSGPLFLAGGTCFNGRFKEIHGAEGVGGSPPCPLHYGQPREGIKGAWAEFILIDLTESSLNWFF